MNDAIAQILEHLPLLSGVVTIVLTGIGLFWKLAAHMFFQHRGYLDEKFKDLATLRAESAKQWERQFDQLKELIERYNNRADELERRLDDFSDKYVDRDRYIHTNQVIDHKITVLARRMEDCQATQCRYAGMKHET